ncbi:helix-turn-helix transcriptional regulator [Spiroplasma endosymbiont of Othius punctulatus]|uniref:helix-turn-helix domain-containing protein n=1 Tax=Spiroplasma endosymbiont of Othius punctulatus TaxID=3066289 RepID=UPI0030CC24A8
MENKNTPEIIMIFAKNMKKIRIERKLSQEQLSFESGLHKNYISDAERGYRNISLKAVEKIAKGLHVNVDELFKK